MSEPGSGTYVGLNYSMIQSLVCALIDAGMLSAADLASACRTTAESLPNELVASELRAFAESLEEAEAGAEGLLAAGWTPEVIPSGKDGGGKGGGGKDGGDASD